MTTNLRDPSLTHIVMCGSKDYDRYGELLEATMVGCVLFVRYFSRAAAAPS